jgi:hypothetical protein
VSVIARSVQFLGDPPNGSNGVNGNDTGGLQAITGSEEEELAIEDQDAIAAAAA